MGMYLKKGQSRRSQERTHYSKEELRMTAIEEEGKMAYQKGDGWESNPKVSLGARSAWWKGWNAALNEAHGEEHV